MKLVKTTALAAAVAASSVFAQAASAEYSANVSVVSDYLFRGITQTAGESAVQGGIDYANESGIYVGTWVSNVGSAGTGDSGNEVDFYVGWSGEVSEGLTLDFGVYSFVYTNRDFFEDYEEIALSLGYGWVSFTALQAVGIAPVVGGEKEDAPYLSLGVDFPVSESVGVNTTVGQWDFENGNDYTHLDVTLSKAIDDTWSMGFGLSTNDAGDADFFDTTTALVTLSGGFDL